MRADDKRWPPAALVVLKVQDNSAAEAYKQRLRAVAVGTYEQYLRLQALKITFCFISIAQIGRAHV